MIIIEEYKLACLYLRAVLIAQNKKIAKLCKTIRNKKVTKCFGKHVGVL